MTLYKTDDFTHYTVMLNETVDFLEIEKNPDGIYIDATLGGGGHSELILSKLSKKGKLISFDIDNDAINAAKKRLGERENHIIVKRSYTEIKDVLAELNIEKITGGIIFDLGASYHQLTKGERGFSFQKDAPLDMRFNQEQDFSAYDVVNSYSESDLVEIFSKYGEEHFSKRIAKAIVQNRPINTTLQLADLIIKSTPKVKTSIHPATRVFQAIRIEVNKELLNFENTLIDVLTLLSCNAIISVISFHSLEDRVVKHYFNEYSKECRCPIKQMICTCGGKILEKITKKPVYASDDELKNNPASRSAKLRAARKISEFGVNH